MLKHSSYATCPSTFKSSAEKAQTDGSDVSEYFYLKYT